MNNNRNKSFFPSGKNTEVQSYGKVEKEVKKYGITFQTSSHNCVVPHIQSSTFVRIRYNTAQTKWYDELDYLKEWPCVNKANIKRVRCVFLHLSKVELKSSVLQVKSKNIIWKKRARGCLISITKTLIDGKQKQPTKYKVWILEFLFAPRMIFLRTGLHPYLRLSSMENIICIAQRRDYRGIDLVARMLMVTYNNWEDEVLKDEVEKP